MIDISPTLAFANLPHFLVLRHYSSFSVAVVRHGFYLYLKPDRETRVLVSTTFSSIDLEKHA